MGALLDMHYFWAYVTVGFLFIHLFISFCCNFLLLVLSTLSTFIVYSQFANPAVGSKLLDMAIHVLAAGDGKNRAIYYTRKIIAPASLVGQTSIESGILFNIWYVSLFGTSCPLLRHTLFLVPYIH